MSAFESAEQAAVVAHLLVRLRADKASGTWGDEAHYVALYTGFEALVRREYQLFFAASNTALQSAEENSSKRHFGPYRLIRELGRGGQAEVHLAEDSRLERRVALKLLRGMGSLDDDSQARFRREALVTSRLDHPGLCTVYEVGAIDSVPYLAMRFVPGQTLAQRIADRQAQGDRSQTRQRAAIQADIAIVESMARAVHAAHEAGVLHRDLKPRNVILDEQGQPVILDFGLARDLQSDGPSLTRSGDVFGTPHYMAPEQIAGAGQETRMTDVWALGVILFELIALRRPFDAPTREALYHQILDQPAPSLARHVRQASRDLCVVVATALQNSSSQRYQTALDLAEELARLRAGVPILARPPGALRRMTAWMRKHPSRTGAIVMGMLALASAGYLSARWPELVAAEERAAQEAFEHRLEHAFFDLSAEKFDEAKDKFERVLVDRPSTPEAIAGLGMIILHREGAEAAEAWRGQHADTYARHAGSSREALELYLDAVAEFGPNHANDVAAMQRARSLLERCILSSTTARALYHYELAHVLFHLETEEASAPLRTALSVLWPNEWQARMWIARLRPFSEAEVAWAELEPLLAERPTDAVLCDATATAAYRCRKFERAHELFERAVQLSPSAVLSTVSLARTLERLGRRQEGIKLLWRFREQYEDQVEISAQLASFLHREGQDREALALLEPLCRSGLPTRDAGITLALILMDLKRREEAEAVLGQLEARYPRQADVLGARASFFSQIGRHEEAVAALRLVLEQRPRSTDVLHDLGTNLEQLGNYAESRELWQRALSIEPNNAELWSALAGSFHHDGLFLKAAEAYAQVVARTPEDVQPVFRLAQAYANASDHDRAAEAYRRTVEMDPTWAEGWCNLGQELRRAGRFDEAVEALTRGHELGVQRDDWNYPSLAWMENAKVSAALARELATADAGQIDHTPAERSALAEVAAAQHQDELAAKLFFAAFEAEPELKNELSQMRRIVAARSVVRWCQSGPMQSDPQVRALWLERARTWVEEEFGARVQAYEEGRGNPARVRQVFQRWLADPAFESVFGASSSARPEIPAQSTWAELRQHIETMVDSIEID